MSLLEVTTLDATTLTNQEPRMAQAWVSFDGTGTPSINDSHNVASITDHGTGDYSAVFSTALANTNYSIVAATSNAQTGITAAGKLTTGARILSSNSAGTATDASEASIIVFGGTA